MKLTTSRLRELLSYDADTGVFTWKVPGRGRRLSGVAGGKTKEGYITIHVDGQTYMAHRLAWLYQTGEWPSEILDHRNGAKEDNRFDNLREADQPLNMQNQRKAQSHNRTGLLGVTFDKSHPGGRKFRAIISVAGKAKRLGWFRLPEEAHQAYLKAKRELHPGCTI